MTQRHWRHILIAGVLFLMAAVVLPYQVGALVETYLPYWGSAVANRTGLDWQPEPGERGIWHSRSESRLWLPGQIAPLHLHHEITHGPGWADGQPFLVRMLTQVSEDSPLRLDSWPERLPLVLTTSVGLDGVVSFTLTPGQGALLVDVMAHHAHGEWSGAGLALESERGGVTLDTPWLRIDLRAPPTEEALQGQLGWRAQRMALKADEMSLLAERVEASLVSASDARGWSVSAQLGAESLRGQGREPEWLGLGPQIPSGPLTLAVSGEGLDRLGFTELCEWMALVERRHAEEGLGRDILLREQGDAGIQALLRLLDASGRLHIGPIRLALPQGRVEGHLFLSRAKQGMSDQPWTLLDARAELSGERAFFESWLAERFAEQLTDTEQARRAARAQLAEGLRRRLLTADEESMYRAEAVLSGGRLNINGRSWPLMSFLPFH